MFLNLDTDSNIERIVTPQAALSTAEVLFFWLIYILFVSFMFFSLLFYFLSILCSFLLLLLPHSYSPFTSLQFFALEKKKQVLVVISDMRKYLNAVREVHKINRTKERKKEGKGVIERGV